MASIKVHKVSINVKEFTTSFFKSKSVKKEIAKQMQSKIKNVAENHYENLLNQVNNSLSEGVSGNVVLGGNQNVLFSDAKGSVKAIRTAGWLGLTRKYRNRKPYSRRFWKKTGRLSQDFRSEISPAYRNPVTVVNVGPLAKKTLLSIFRNHFQVRFARLPEPLDTYLRQSFIQATEKTVPELLLPDKRTTERIVYVEGRRPYIAKLAARLGRDLHSSLKHL